MTTTMNSRLNRLALVAAGALFCSTAAMAAGAGTSDAAARYQYETARCKSGQSQQDYATCMKEAGAALEENRRGALTNDGRTEYRENAMVRCDVLTGTEREACYARMQGAGEVTGSVGGGGVLRELVITEPAKQ